MTKWFWVPFLLLFILPSDSLSQENSPIEEEGDEMMIDFANLVQTEENKAYCSSRILGQTPMKIISLGYDLQTAHALQIDPFLPGGPEASENITNTRGLRLGINYPIYSKNDLLVNLGFNYAASNYSFETPALETDNPLFQALDNNGLSTLGFTATIFKPINIKRYFIIQFGANLNGDYALSNIQALRYTRYTASIIYGIKPNDRKMWGFGATRTYLGGALNYLPVYYMMYTSENKKWGLEMVLPARFQYRRNIDDKNLLLLGWEVEGNTYRINNDGDPYGLPYNDMELRRAELRLRATWEHALTPQIWLSAQAGFRYNWSYDVDRDDFFRSFGDDTPYLVETDLGNPAYFNLSINWVSP
jgi:hypothetical protein